MDQSAETPPSGSHIVSLSGSWSCCSCEHALRVWIKCKRDSLHTFDYCTLYIHMTAYCNTKEKKNREFNCGNTCAKGLFSAYGYLKQTWKPFRLQLVTTSPGGLVWYTIPRVDWRGPASIPSNPQEEWFIQTIPEWLPDLQSQGVQLIADTTHHHQANRFLLIYLCPKFPPAKTGTAGTILLHSNYHLQ